MNRKVTKVSTVTPKSTLTKSKSIGQGVKNIANAKKYGPVSMAMGKKAAKEGSMEAASSLPQLAMKSERSPMPRIGMTTKVERKNAGMPSIGMEYTSMPMPNKQRMTTSKTTTKQKAKAKMLPEVTVTAPKPKKRLALKITSKRK